MDKETIDKLYKSGKMPLKYYNQLNGKNAQENYAEYKRLNNNNNISLLDREAENELKKLIENSVDDIIKMLFKP